MTEDRREKGLLYTDEDLALFKDYYMTNEHCFAEQLPPNENNKARWNKVENGSADFVSALKSHLEGDRTIGAYTIILDGPHKDCCKNCTFDFDLSSEIRKESKQLENEEQRNAHIQNALSELENRVREFLSILSSVHINNDQILVSFSGYKGFHVDIFFSTPIPAKKVFEFVNILKNHAGLPKSMEVFPKQPSAANAYGSLVKLPMGIHKLTGKRAKFVDLFDTDASSFGTPFDYLRRTKKLTLDDLHDVINSVSESQLNIGTYSEQEDIKDLSQPPTCASLSKMMTGCNALKRMVAKATKDKHLLHEERLALLMLCMHFGEQGVAKIHEIIKNCTDYSKEETDKMITHAKDHRKYRPITCARMQDMHICSKNCAEILARSGLSPIKLAYPKAKVDAKLELVEDVEKTQYIGKTISVPFKADSLIGSSYTLPKECIFTCSEGCPARTGEKIICEHNNKSGETKVSIPDDSDILLSFTDSPDAVVKKALLGFAKIPCLKPSFIHMEKKSFYHMQGIMITSADEVIRNQVFKNKTVETKSYVAYFNGDNINISTDYIGIGKIHPHPRTQKTTFLFSKLERMLGNLDEFNPSPEQLEHLKAYKEMDKSEFISKLADQVADIRGRDREALVVMLTLLSPLQIEFNNRPLDRGWIESCFIGDSSQGKSELPKRILSFVGTLNMVSGANTTAAGMVGGVDKHDNTQYISWGVLPNSDKTIVFMDEVEKLQQNSDAFHALREIRTSGKAVISKIRKGTKICRVRIIASANAEKGKSMDMYKRGCQAIMGIMEGPDARRFDIFQFFFKDDVSVDVSMRESLERKIDISQEMLRTVVLWAWTRDITQIKFTQEVTKDILLRARKLSAKFQAASATIPIITTDAHIKLARITAAMAMVNMRTDDFEKLIPTMADVQMAYTLLDETYASRNVALDEEALECDRKLSVPTDWLMNFRRLMKRHELSQSIDIVEAVAHINTLDRIRADELCLYLRASRTDITKLLQLMAVDSLLESDYGGTYKPTTKMNRLIKLLRDTNPAYADSLKDKKEAPKEGNEEDIFDGI